MKEIYLDNSATTQVDDRVIDYITKVMREHYGNPSSLYDLGLQSHLLMEEAAKSAAALIGGRGENLYFTSGGTESNNWAVFGTAHAKRRRGKRMVTTAFEHSSVLEPMKRLGEEGFDPVFVKPDEHGIITAESFLSQVTPDTILVSFMLVNNEVGTLLPYEEIAEEVRRIAPNATIHCDAVQAYGKLPLKVEKLPIDLVSMSGHKIHAPKGIGALYLSDRLVQAFQPPYLGGEQERQMRPGTENLPYAMGLAAAATRLAKTMKSRDTAMRALNRQLREGLKAFPEVVINSPENAVPEVLNFSEMCIKSETMLAFLAEEQIYVSSASACGRGQPSHTLAAMGRDPLAIDTAIRVSFCADNTPEDVDAFLNRFEDGMKHLQKIRK